MAIISTFSPAVPRVSMIQSSSSFFDKAKEAFVKALNDGFYSKEEDQAFYLHRIQTKFRSYTGFVSLVDLEDYAQGRIIKHEHTIEAKAIKTLELYRERAALIKPVLLTYPNVFEIDALINRLTFSIKPLCEFDYQNDEHHTFWRISQPEHIERFTALFEQKVPKLYIADGHHRCETSLLYRNKITKENPNLPKDSPFNFLFVEMYSVSEIEVHNYNRYIKNLNGLRASQFIKLLENDFIVTPSSSSVKPSTEHKIGMYLEEKWYALEVKLEVLAELKTLKSRLDVQIFNELILLKILKVENVRTWEDIGYIEGPEGTQGLCDVIDSGEAIVGFNLYPLPIEDLFKLAESNEVLPPKSTWFLPRLRSALMAHLFDC